MNTEKFGHYLKIGHGRAVTMLQDAENKEPYRQMVYDMAVEDVRFDRQTNSYRGKYILDLVRCFPDSEKLLSEIFDHYGNVGLNDDLTGYYLSNLYEMASEERGAVEALLKIYDSIYDALKNGRGTDTTENYLWTFVFESAAHFLIGADAVFAERIIHDTVLLYGISMITDDTIQTVFHSLENKLGHVGFEAFLDRMKKELPATEDIYAIYLKSQRVKTHFHNPYDPETKKEYDVNSVDDLLAYYKKYGRQLSPEHSYWKKVTEADVKRIADIILGYEECEVRRLTAIQFGKFWTDKEYAGFIPPFPYDASVISEIVRNMDVGIGSGDYVAYVSIAKIAGNMKSEENRAFALLNVEKKFTERHDETVGFYMHSFIMNSIIANYREEDAEILYKAAKKIDDAYILEEFSYSLVNDLFPSLVCANETEKKLLYYLYENLYCTNCRGKAAEQIVRLGLLTDEMRREMKYDTSIKIRQIV